MKHWTGIAISLLAAATAVPASAQLTQPAAGAVVFGDSGDTAWVLAASALVALIALPGLLLYVAGRVQRRNAASVGVQTMAVVALASLVWVVIGYSLAFAPGDVLIGGTDNIMLNALGTVRDGTTIPETAFAVFELCLALLAPALIVGAVVERVRFGWLLAWTGLWSLLVYAPVAHWLWGDGWLAELGSVDFGGGIVVLETAGVSALVVAMLLGRRAAFADATPPHAPLLSLAGAAILWVGWFGLVGGAAFSASDDAAAAILAMHVAASAGALAGVVIERLRHGKASAAGIAGGAIAGLAAITPAAGLVGIGAAIIIGGAGATAAFAATRLIRDRFAVDDTLSVFATLGVAAIVGALLLAPFMAPALGGTGYADGVSMLAQIGLQAAAVAVVGLWAGGVSLILALGLALVLPMRVSAEQEAAGLDHASHGEAPTTES